MKTPIAEYLPANGDNEETMNRRVREIVLLLFQMEKETRGYGLGFSALLIQAAALSFSFERQDIEKRRGE